MCINFDFCIVMKCFNKIRCDNKWPRFIHQYPPIKHGFTIMHLAIMLWKILRSFFLPSLPFPFLSFVIPTKWKNNPNLSILLALKFQHVVCAKILQKYVKKREFLEIVFYNVIMECMLNITFSWAKLVFDDHKLQCISLKQKKRVFWGKSNNIQCNHGVLLVLHFVG